MQQQDALCWCCPSCCSPTLSPSKHRRSSRPGSKLVSRHSPPLTSELSSPPKKAFSLPAANGFPLPPRKDITNLFDSLEPCSGCQRLQVPLGASEEGIMCLRCQRRRSPDRADDMSKHPPAQLPVDEPAMHGLTSFSNGEMMMMADPFLEDEAAIPAETDDVNTLFVDEFLHNNRLEHLVQVMGYHPRYLDAFLKTQTYMLRGDGPLPFEYRHYIAIMAAGRHQCSYLIHIQINEFLLQGGDPRWLKGLEHAPKKLRDIYEVNKILAHRPWLLSKAHIEKLTSGNDNWSLSELMHALVILAHFHALASFVYGCGINAEMDSEEGHTYQLMSTAVSDACALSASSGRTAASSAANGHTGSTPNSASEEGGGIEVLMERMKKLTEEAQEEMTQEELQKRFERVETQSAELPAASKQLSPKADIMRYVEDPDFTYQDFAKRGTPSDIPTFRAQDYSWEEQGFSLANRLYSDIGKFLDDKFTIAKHLTYYTMGDRNHVDTSSFRRSIWNYIHCMFGIRHDDYDYSEVNQLLERALKAYMKTVTCYPERCTRKDYDSFMREFKHSEKVHVNLMLLEARQQAELLYVLRAINKHMT